MLALDCETTGLDLYHGARPFFVSICRAPDFENRFWLFPVDPITRAVEIPPSDLKEIQDVIDRVRAEDDESIVLQNARFDINALYLTGITDWPWHKTHDTLLAGHILASNGAHDLTTMSAAYLGIDLQPYESALEIAVKQSRQMARARHPEWRLAEKGDPMMPSVREKAWKYDAWLPRIVAVAEGYPPDHPWHTVLADYCNADSASTLALMQRMIPLMQRRGVYKLYLERCKAIRLVCGMERRGVAILRKQMDARRSELSLQSRRAGRECVMIAGRHGYKLELPRSGNNRSLLDYIFDVMRLPVVRSMNKGRPRFDQYALSYYLDTLDEGPALSFLRHLQHKRKCDTALQYLDGYRRFCVSEGGVAILHPSLNMAGTHTLRWSSSNPNSQQISKQEKYGLRDCFGPAPGREWWSMDAKNLELRIPAYEAGEEEMIAVFERPEDPPYYGSYHLLVFDILHPELFARDGANCKAIYESTWYQWTKNGNFAVGYGSVESSGTADRAYRVPGAFRRIKDRFKRIHGPGGLNDRMLSMAKRLGYVETIPDRSLDPKRGYPLMCKRSGRGIVPTTPLNYHVQGTACWWMLKAMLRCQEYLDEVNRERPGGYYMVLQVHDELVFDFPARRGISKGKMVLGNLPVVRKLKQLMERCGEDIGVPTPVSVEYHAHHWGNGIPLLGRGA